MVVNANMMAKPVGKVAPFNVLPTSVVPAISGKYYISKLRKFTVKLCHTWWCGVPTDTEERPTSPSGASLKPDTRSVKKNYGDPETKSLFDAVSRFVIGGDTALKSE